MILKLSRTPSKQSGTEKLEFSGTRKRDKEERETGVM
jgi:hypothetical protein